MPRTRTKTRETVPPLTDIFMPFLVIFAVFGHMAIACLTHVIVRDLLVREHVPPLVALTMRCLVASAVLVPTLLFRPLSAEVRAVFRARWRRIVALAALAVLANQVCYIVGLRYAPAVHGALIFCLMPLLLAVIQAVTGKGVTSRLTWIGTVGAVVGVFIVLEERGLTFTVESLRGDAIIFGAVLAWCAVTLLSRPILAQVPSFELSRAMLVLGTVFLLPVTASDLRAFDLAGMSGRVLACMLFLGVCTSVLAYVLWYYLLRRIGALRSAMVINLQPIGTAILAWAWLDEPIGWQLAVGGTIVIAGVVAVQISESGTA